MAGQFLFEYCGELWLNRVKSRNSFIYFVLGKWAALTELVAQSWYLIAVYFIWSFLSTWLKLECNYMHLFVIQVEGPVCVTFLQHGDAVWLCQLLFKSLGRLIGGLTWDWQGWGFSQHLEMLWKKQTCGKQPPLIGIKAVISRGARRGTWKKNVLGTHRVV